MGDANIQTELIFTMYVIVLAAHINVVTGFPSSCIKDAKKIQETSDFLDAMKFERLGINAERMREEEDMMGTQGAVDELEPLEHEEKENRRCSSDFGILLDRFGDTIYYFLKLDKYFVELNWFPAEKICANQSKKHSEKEHDEKNHHIVSDAHHEIFGSNEGNKTFFFTGMMDLASGGMYALEVSDESLFEPWPGEEGSLADEDPESCPQARFVPENKNCTLHNGKVLCGVFQVCGD